MWCCPQTKRKWNKNELEDLHKSLARDIAYLLQPKREVEFIEICCSPNSMLTNIAKRQGVKSERWTINDYNLATTRGFQEAESRLRQCRPKRIWLSPECGPFSQMQHISQRTEQQKKDLMKNGKLVSNSGKVAWGLAEIQLSLGGYFYIEQPKTCMTWKLEDNQTKKKSRSSTFASSLRAQ